jgi:glutaredoxin
MTASAGSVIVTLYTREGCHLCDEARAAIAPAIVRVGAELREIDIDDDAELRAMYNDSVPLIFVGADFFGRYRVDAKKFEKALEAAGRKS